MNLCDCAYSWYVAAGRVSQQCCALQMHTTRGLPPCSQVSKNSKSYPTGSHREIRLDNSFPSVCLYFIHRRGHNVLKVQLPSKEEHVILVRLSKIQRALYTEFMNRFRDAGNSGWLGLNPLKAFCVCCKVGFGRRCKETF